ncbi:MAG TPA: hypothetical protein VG797_07125 [Phycisphaerales bacterium]|nr:hypothetical protein [Phycisphaerales bacterium]
MNSSSGRSPNADGRSPKEVAEDFVAIALVQPVFKALRESSELGAWGPFKPGAHERAFGAMQDWEAARRIVKAKHFPVVDAVARELEHMSKSPGTEAAIYG